MNKYQDEILDYMAEYHMVPELILSGLRPDDSWTLEVAKVGGGTLGFKYVAYEHWIVNSFVNCELVESVIVAPTADSSHMDVITAFAKCWFGV